MASAAIFNLPSDEGQRSLLQTLASHLFALAEHSNADTPTAWFAPASWDALRVASTLEADSFVNNVFAHLRIAFGVSSRKAHASTYENSPIKSMAVFSPTDSAIKSKLSLVYHERSIYAFVSGSNAFPIEGDIRPWLSAIDFATTELSKAAPLQPWQAVIGLAPSQHQATPDLGSAVLELGSISLQRCDFKYTERIASTSLSSWSTFTWQPVIVSGASPGYDWQSASFNAHSQIHAVCALLSLESAACWTLREAPRPNEWGAIYLPDETPLGIHKAKPDAPEFNRTEERRIDAERLGRLWKHWNENENARLPVEAYYRGISLKEQHPSFSLVAFVAAIEEVGKLLIPAKKEEQCPQCRKAIVSSATQRFRAALSLVLPEEKVAVVSQRLYRWRSGTAHAGRTHAWEATFGQWRTGDSLLEQPTQSMFNFRGPMHAEELSRALLFKLFGDDSVSTETIAKAKR